MPKSELIMKGKRMQLQYFHSFFDLGLAANKMIPNTAQMTMAVICGSA
jgi:hypothetical protein